MKPVGSGLKLTGIEEVFCGAMKRLHIAHFEKILRVLPCAALLALISCSPGDSDGRGEETVSPSNGASAASGVPAAEVCDGTISGDAVEALENISGESEFAEESSPLDLGEFLQVLNASEAIREQFCEIYAANSVDVPFARIYFRWIGGDNFETSGDGALFAYSTGEAAYVTEHATLIYFPCVIEGESTHSLIGANLDTEIRGSSAPDSKMAILNSVSRAVAERLGCLDESGLVEGTPEQLAD